MERLTRRERARLWLVEYLPAGLLYHPAEALLAMAGVVSGVRFVLTGPESESLQEQLPPPVVGAWGLMLFIGSVALINGLASIARADDGYVVTRVPAYRLGLRLLGATAGIYAVCLVSFAGTAGLTAALFPLAFSGMCGLRLLSLGGR